MLVYYVCVSRLFSLLVGPSFPLHLEIKMINDQVNPRIFFIRREALYQLTVFVIDGRDYPKFCVDLHYCCIGVV